DDEYLLDVAGKIFDVTLQLVFIGMSGKRVNGCDTGPDGVRFAENVDRILAGEDLRTQGVCRAVADEQDQVLGPANMVFEMMANAPGLAHARRADDDGRVLQFV